jgi:enoyl-CoA hydratase
VLPLNIAMEAALTGDPIDASTAHRRGLVNALCAPGEALETALALAERVAANAPSPSSNRAGWSPTRPA